jgi:radical SAM superfamily enzyme YgiQ (UPF0313 family)
MLKIYKKNIKLEILYDMVTKIQSAGIQVATLFLLGGPTETEEDFLKTLRLVKRLKPDYAQFNGLAIIPGTQIYNLAIKENVVSPEYYPAYIKNPFKNFTVPFWNKGITEETMTRWLFEAYTSFYFSPRYLFKSIFNLGSSKDFVVKFKAGIIMLGYVLKLLLKNFKIRLKMLSWRR